MRVLLLVLLMLGALGTALKPRTPLRALPSARLQRSLRLRGGMTRTV